MASKRLSASIVIGGAISGTLRGAFASANKNLVQLGAAVRKLSAEQKTLSKGIDTFGRMGKNVDGLREKYTRVTAQLEKMRAATERLARAERAREANLAKRAELRGQMVDAVAIGAAAAAPIAAAVKFENAMLGVAKQLNGARDSSGKLTKTYFDMQAAIQKLGRELPVSTNAIAEMVTAGLRMGVASDQVLEFVRRSAEMSTAFELPEADLAESMGKIAGLYKIPIPAIGALADSINYLDDNAISKGGDIIEYMQRVGGVASAVKITSTEVAALGSTLLTLGERTETASTATNAMMQKLAAADKGTKKFKSAVREIGLSTATIQKGMQVDAMGTMLKVMDAISKLPMDKQLGVMVELVGLEHSDTMAKLANNTGELRKQLELANSEAAKGSMSREFQARMQTTNAQWTVSKNRLTEIGVTIGSVMLPALNDLMQTVGPVVSKFAEWAKDNPLLMKALVGTATALVGLRIGTLAFGYGLTFIKGAALSAWSAIAKLRAGVTLATARFGGIGGVVRQVGFALVRTPWGAAVAGLVAAGVLVWREWDRIKSFFSGLWTGITEGLAPVKARIDEWSASFPFIGKAIDAVGTAVSGVIDWFGRLFEPVNHSKAELEAAGKMGQNLGEWIAKGIDLALVPLGLLIDGLRWVSDNIGSVISSVKSIATEGADKVSSAWDSTKSFLGFGDDEAKPAAGGGQAAPALPSPAARGAGNSYQDNSQTTIQVTQQPGQSQDQLAKKLADEIERRKQQRERAAMTDGAYAQ
ncbi:phage tail tape measure protein [Microvirga sp. 17 mud 1-3]|uniref:phage tail tape measure protein n=1 Tax=Microvirga sp. 17 mud 1-3 TaxID=2082949 RepID=UPI000D6B9B83|nr:phage tail tape measure protein [Microvirga sp. 17 mud 1-3]AWM87379.1 phage tail tape measure protein [Microvirga sp. 17 mud 1-3]